MTVKKKAKKPPIRKKKVSRAKPTRRKKVSRAKPTRRKKVIHRRSRKKAIAPYKKWWHYGRKQTFEEVLDEYLEEYPELDFFDALDEMLENESEWYEYA